MRSIKKPVFIHSAKALDVKTCLTMPSARHVFAPITLDTTFKRIFGNKRKKRLLLFLLNTFLKEVLTRSITDVKKVNTVEVGETNEHKTTVFDLQCEDAAGNRFIVEMQVGEQEYFIKRTFFYLCRAVSNIVKKGKRKVDGKDVPYDYNIPVVYTLSFLSFDLDFGESCNEVIQYLELSNRLHPEIRYDIMYMVYVRLTEFNKTKEECKTDIDKLMFSFKNAHKETEKPANFKKPEYEEIYELAKISNFNAEELMTYEQKMKHMSDYANSIAFAEKKGEVKGIAIGEAKGLKKAAYEMKLKGMHASVIAEVTGLSVADIEGL